MINWTIGQNLNQFACVDWCKQEFQHAMSEFEVSNLEIIVASLVITVIKKLIMRFHQVIIEKGDIKEEKLQSFVIFLDDISMYVLIGFFIRYFWF